jgi:hypothetical protein
MKRIVGLVSRFPVIVAGGLFMVIGVPINYIFLGDRPNNPLEQAEEIVIKSITGIDVDLSPESEN